MDVQIEANKNLRLSRVALKQYRKEQQKEKKILKMK